MLNQYAYETQNLIGLVTSAISGNIYANVFTSNKLLTELKKIKINLPAGTYLPVELSAESLPQLFRITDISVIHKNHFLIFVTKIPLIVNEEFNVYRPIPLPVQLNNETIFILPKNQWEACKQLKHNKLCKGNQPIHHRASSELCEIQLLSNQQKIPETCKIKFLSLENSIWHSLKHTNSWLFYTKFESSIMTCISSIQPVKIEISGGTLSTSPNCEIHTTNSIMLPRKGNIDVDLDLIPENLNTNSLHLLAETLKYIVPQNLTNVKVINDFVELARKALNVNELAHKDTNTPLILKVEFNIIMLYTLICIIIVVCILIIKTKNKTIRVYEPELAINSTKDNIDKNVHEETNV
jgi:hypothetical protein